MCSKAILESIAFPQNVTGPRYYSRPLHAVLRFGIDVSGVEIHPHNPLVSDHFQITLKLIQPVKT